MHFDEESLFMTRHSSVAFSKKMSSKKRENTPLEKRIQIIFEKTQCYTVLFVLIPSFLMFEILLVRPVLVDMFEMGIVKQLMHIALAIFCFINVTGNMIMSIMTDTSLNLRMNRRRCEDSSYCDKCKVHQPARSWHCSTCNVCILRRDHHCTFLSRCIGLRNKRYYVSYLVHLCISMVYSSYYNYYFIRSKLGDYSIIMSVLRLLQPLLRYAMNEPLAMRDLYAFFYFLNVLLIIWMGFLCGYHMRNVLWGITSHEANKTKHEFNPSKLKENLMQIFGTRWYFALLWPFIDSPLPENVREA